MSRNRILVLAAFALVVAACGGSSDTTESRPIGLGPLTTTLAPPADGGSGAAVSGGGGVSGGGVVSPKLAAVQLAMSNTVAAPPARIDGLIEMSGSVPDLGDITVSIPFSSSFDTVTGDGHMSMDFSEMAQTMGDEIPPELAGMFDRFEVRQVGDTAYMQFGVLTMMFGAETPWIAMPAEDGQGFAQDFSSGVSPYDATSLLDSLTQAGGEVAVVGSEVLRGADTTRYRVVFDIDDLASLDPDAYAEIQDAVAVGFDELPMDLWIDDQDRIHRYLFEVSGADLGDFGADDTLGHMRVQFDFSDYGGRVEVQPPPADQVTDIADLDDLFGGLSGLEEIST